MIGFNSTDSIYIDSQRQTGVEDFLWFLVLDQYGLVSFAKLNAGYRVHMLMGSWGCAGIIRVRSMPVDHSMSIIFINQ